MSICVFTYNYAQLRQKSMELVQQLNEGINILENFVVTNELESCAQTHLRRLNNISIRLIE